MKFSVTIFLLFSVLFSCSSYSADLSFNTTPDLAAAEQHIISGTTAYIFQNGQKNIALLEQSDALIGNFAHIDQKGSNNWVSALQAGDLNFVNIQQYGNDNISNSQQTGIANSINLTQNQNGNQFNAIQLGNNNVFNAIQNGNSIITMSAQGNGNTISADLPAGTNYQINVVGDNVKASSTGQ